MSKQNEINELLLAEGVVENGSEPTAEIETADHTSEETGTEPIGEQEFDVKGIAEKLGIEAKEVYNLKVPMADGAMLTLGELKDLSATSRTEREGYEKANAELMTQHKNLAILSELMTPDMARYANASIEAHAKREVALLSKALPTWADSAVAAREEKQIFELTKKYGMSQAETDALVTDHRFVKLLRDVAVKQMVAESSTPKAAVRSNGNATSNKAVLDRARNADATKQDKLAAINALIN